MHRVSTVTHGTRGWHTLFRIMPSLIYTRGIRSAPGSVILIELFPTLIHYEPAMACLRDLLMSMNMPGLLNRTQVLLPGISPSLSVTTYEGFEQTGVAVKVSTILWLISSSEVETLIVRMASGIYTDIMQI
jgi:hypothetical protein